MGHFQKTNYGTFSFNDDTVQFQCKKRCRFFGISGINKVIRNLYDS